MTEVMFTLVTLFVLYVVYKSAAKKNQQHVSSTQAEVQKPSAPDVVSHAKPEIPVAAVKPPIPKAATKKSKVTPAKPVVKATGLGVEELVGMSAGSIWSYLDKNGPTTVAKLIRDLPEDEKTVQRSIGWLAQEDKITLEVIDRAETISLKIQ
jgi:predicted DNA-binding transcriptional regulator AlpA